MTVTLAIARRELRSLFDSPIAYVVIVTFLLISSWIFFSTLFLIGRADLRLFFAPSLFSPSALLAVIVPAITMRLVAEERKTGTIELLMTLPVRDIEVILGKFLGAVVLVYVALAPTILFPITVSLLGPLDWGPVISGYLGLILFVAALTALGLLCSTLTENQIIAFIISVSVSLALYFVYGLQVLMPPALGSLIEFISVGYHLENLARGVIDSRDVLYYLTLTGGALFLAERALARQHA